MPRSASTSGCGARISRHRRRTRRCCATRGSSQRKMRTPSSKGLDQIADEFERDGVPERVELEDIHMTVEHRLAELIGPAAGRLHTARSRNDQVATDFRMWVRNACDEALASIRDLQRGLVDGGGACRNRHARLHAPAGRPAGDARPSSARLLRDAPPRRVALRGAVERMNECPLGAAALAGTGFPIDREATAKALGFDRADRKQPRQRIRPRFRARLSVRRGPVQPAPFAARRGADHLGEPAVRLRQAVGRVLDRLVDHAAEAQSRRSGAGARA